MWYSISRGEKVNLSVGDKVTIHCYKHDGSIHKSWKYAYVLDIKEDLIVLGNENVLVTTEDGRTWRTKEPAIMFFYNNRWFNVIAQIKSNGLFYYCNIASPYVIDGNVVKYIDYDLDLRIFPDGTFRVLDRGEYEYHKEKMQYGSDIDEIVNYELNNLIELYKNKEGPFDSKYLRKYYDKYLKIQKNSKKSKIN